MLKTYKTLIYRTDPFFLFCMQLIAIGESLKNLDKVVGKEFLLQCPQIDWKGAKGMRDIITHHYFDLDAEAVYDVCENNLPEMHSVLERMIRDIA